MLNLLRSTFKLHSGGAVHGSVNRSYLVVMGTFFVDSRASVACTFSSASHEASGARVGSG